LLVKLQFKVLGPVNGRPKASSDDSNIGLSCQFPKNSYIDANDFVQPTRKRLLCMANSECEYYYSSLQISSSPCFLTTRQDKFSGVFFYDVCRRSILQWEEKLMNKEKPYSILGLLIHHFGSLLTFFSAAAAGWIQMIVSLQTSHESWWRGIDFYLKISTSLTQHKQHGGHHPTSFGLNLNDVATSQGFIIRAMYHLRKQTLYQDWYYINHLGGDLVVRVWDQEVCSLCGLRFEPCGCSYDGHWRLTWSLTSGLMGLVEVRASWPRHPR